MPIAGLTDRQPSFKELGRLRLGIPKSEAARSGPREISYFRADFRPDAMDAADLFLKTYGAQPTAVSIRLPFLEIERVWDAFYMVYNRGGLLGKADGEKWIYLRDPRSGRLIVRDGVPEETNGFPIDENGNHYYPFDKTVPVYSYKSQKGEDVAVYAKPEGRLRILVPELHRAAYLSVITHSIYNIIKISEQLGGIQQLARNVEMTLPMMPLILTRRLEPISVTYGGKKQMQERYLLNLEVHPEWMSAHWNYMDAQLPGVLLKPVGQLPHPALTGATLDEIDEIEADDAPEPEPEPEYDPRYAEESPEENYPGGTIPAEAWEAWHELVNQATGYKVDVRQVSRPRDIEEMREAYKNLQAQVKAARTAKPVAEGSPQ